ncbi:MAG: sulfur oxidation c-type cytochrome SoxA [Gammaproteobacteria bacterium]|nr:MAG: sulfur oxidation c-type cytochrome SoxA [Gammaproteobacteria bacterium]
MRKPLKHRIVLLLFVTSTPLANPAQDLLEFREHFKNSFPTLPFDQFSNGVYAINEDARLAWEDIEEFPPYEEAIDAGKVLYESSFSNGKSYKDCFENDGIAIAHKYPYWDKEKEQVITLGLALNQCRRDNGEEGLSYKRGEIAYLLSYMAHTSRGKRIAIKSPDDHRKALSAYNKGKQFYYQRRGQLNFSCATCHVQNGGLQIRSETISPSLGHATGWPVYRAKWGEVGTLHRRFIGCSKQMRAKIYDPQGEEYRNLEYYLTYMSNSLPINGPSYRK